MQPLDYYGLTLILGKCNKNTNRRHACMASPLGPDPISHVLDVYSEPMEIVW